MITRRAVIFGVLAFVLLASGTFYHFFGRDYVFRFSEEQIRQALAERLPVERIYLFIFKITLDHPRVQLIEGSDRINAGLDISLDITLPGRTLTLEGTIDASGGLRYDASAGQFFLTDPVIEQVRMSGIPEDNAARASTVMTRALAEYYASHPIYTLNPSDLRQAAAKLVLKSVVVENRTLVVRLGVGT